jgi:hypothetical protein
MIDEERMRRGRRESLLRRDRADDYFSLTVVRRRRLNTCGTLSAGVYRLLPIHDSPFTIAYSLPSTHKSFPPQQGFRNSKVITGELQYDDHALTGYAVFIGQVLHTLVIQVIPRSEVEMIVHRNCLK